MGVPSRNRGVASGWRIMRWHSPSTLGRPLLILSIIVQLHGARVVERPRTLGAAASPQAHRGGTPRERGAARGHPRPRPRDGLRRRPTRSLPVHQPALAARVRPDQRAVRGRSKFTPPDGSITVRSSNVDDNGRVRVEVADTGAGIAPNVLVSCSTRSSRAKRTARTAGRPRGWGWPPRGGLRRPVSASNRLTPLPRRAPAGED